MPDCDNNSKAGVHLFCAVLLALCTSVGIAFDFPLWVIAVWAVFSGANFGLAKLLWR